MDPIQTAATLPPASAQPAASARNNISSDFETFLRMMTTQMQHQDPLDPMDSSQLAVQLATFSGVEQQVRTNELIEGLGAQFALSTLSELAGWVGMEARVSGPVYFNGAPLEIHPQTAPLADRAELVVQDRLGREIQRVPFDPAAPSVQWAGVDRSGTPLAAGAYSFQVQAYSQNAPLPLDRAEVYQPIHEVRRAGTATLLLMPGDLSVDATQITALRTPPPAARF